MKTLCLTFALAAATAVFAASDEDVPAVKELLAIPSVHNDVADILRLQAVMKRLYPERSCNLIRSLGATDARYFTQFKKPIPMFGMACAGGHSTCEWCEIKDIDRFTSLLVEVMSE